MKLFTVLCYAFFYLFLFNETSSIGVLLIGPGLDPEKIVMPARYFYIYLNDTNSHDKAEVDLLNVSIVGVSHSNKPCHLWTQLLKLNDSTAVIRYRLYETCYDLNINIQFKSHHVKRSPFSFKGPVLPEECYCPANDINSWLADFGCKDIHSQILKDLRNYKGVNFENFYDKAVKRFNNSLSSSICHYVVKSNKVYRSCYGKYVGFKVFMDAILLSLMRKVSFPDFEIFVNLGDWPLIKASDKLKFPLFSWCGSNDSEDIVMPTYGITESTLENMGRVSLDMLSVQGNIKKKWNEKTKKAFWRGRDSSLERLKLVQLSRKFPNLIDASLTNFFFYRDKQDEYGPKVEHVSFFKFFDYKYQLNLDGTVAAYRFPFLLAGDSVVFKQDSKYYEHFYSDLQPWVHYIPVKSNLEDLVERLEWVLKNDGKAEEIAKAGQAYARDNLMPQDIFCYHANLFYEWSKKLESPVNLREGMEHVEQKNFKSCDCKKSKKDEL